MFDVLVASSEVVPFAKTGGLADVCGALPVELARLGVRPVVIMPAFRCALQSGQPVTPTGVEFDLTIGTKVQHGRLLRSTLPDSDVEVYLVEQPEYYDRTELYGEEGQDYQDNCERFVFFCRAVMESIRQMQWPIDVIHGNDWQAGLLPAYLEIEYRTLPGFEQIATLMTIHNLAYQGSFWHWDMLLTGIDWKYFNWHQMEFYDRLNFLKTGIVFSDSINTVSPRYAEEIQQAEWGCGLEGVLRHRSDVLGGIINGIDDQVWNPQIDPLIAARYDADHWKEGKARCKAALQEEVGLPQESKTPLIGMIGRLASQKGWDLIIELMRRWVPKVDIQWVILGTGDPQYHQALGALSSQYPSRVAACLTFSNELAHRIEAGADLFLMPSQYEPCGLNQLYSLKYGAVPVVHATGGLADTIVDASTEAMQNHQANGFCFESFSTEALQSTLRRAIDLFVQQPAAWDQLVTTGMKQDWSWKQSAQHYVRLYEQTIQRRKASMSLSSA